ncbi:hypothetical protein LguiB_028955 [Lonicera macranthoides]
MNYLYYAFNQRAKAREPNNNKVSNYIYRDELSKKKTKLQSTTTKLKGEMEEVSLLQREEYSEKKFIFDKKDHQRLQVKILMTKQEAARLLSKCKNGGVLEFNDLARELARIPVDRVSLGNSALVSIPEEF